MPVIVVANPKGGVGKSTLSTNIAGYMAYAGHTVMLGDVDKQQSARTWLSARPPIARIISGWDVRPDFVVRPPRGTSHVVLDTPAGFSGLRLDEVVKMADKIVVPLQPSIFDINATFEFVRELVGHRDGGKAKIGVVGMRVREGTNSSGQLRDFLATLGVPVVTYLRDTQNYIQLAARGLTLWDVAPSRVERDLEQWQPLIEWIEKK